MEQPTTEELRDTRDKIGDAICAVLKEHVVTPEDQMVATVSLASILLGLHIGLSNGDSSNALEHVSYQLNALMDQFKKDGRD